MYGYDIRRIVFYFDFIQIFHFNNNDLPILYCKKFKCYFYFCSVYFSCRHFWIQFWLSFLAKTNLQTKIENVLTWMYWRLATRRHHIKNRHLDMVWYIRLRNMISYLMTYFCVTCWYVHVQTYILLFLSYFKMLNCNIYEVGKPI